MISIQKYCGRAQVWCDNVVQKVSINPIIKGIVGSAFMLLAIALAGLVMWGCLRYFIPAATTIIKWDSVFGKVMMLTLVSGGVMVGCVIALIISIPPAYVGTKLIKRAIGHQGTMPSLDYNEHL